MKRILFLLTILIYSCNVDEYKLPEEGPQGEAGLSCWDTNGNNQGDAAEDRNGDGNFDTSLYLWLL